MFATAPISPPTQPCPFHPRPHPLCAQWSPAHIVGLAPALCPQPPSIVATGPCPRLAPLLPPTPRTRRPGSAAPAFPSWSANVMAKTAASKFSYPWCSGAGRAGVGKFAGCCFCHYTGQCGHSPPGPKAPGCRPVHWEGPRDQPSRPRSTTRPWSVGRPDSVAAAFLAPKHWAVGQQGPCLPGPGVPGLRSRAEQPQPPWPQSIRRLAAPEEPDTCRVRSRTGRRGGVWMGHILAVWEGSAFPAAHGLCFCFGECISWL